MGRRFPFPVGVSAYFHGAFAVCFREASPVIGKYQAKGSGAAVVTVPTSVKSLMLRMVDTGPKLGEGGTSPSYRLVWR